MTNHNPPVQLRTSNGIAEIRFNRPGVLNAIDVETANAFRSAVQSAIAQPDTRVIVLAGEGRAFVAGGDLRYFRDAGEQAPEAARTLIAPMHEAIECLAAAPQPVLASVHGAVAGAGMSLAMAADLVVAAEGTVFNLAYVQVGNSPDCAATWSLTRLVGLHRAMEIALLGDNLSAAEALNLGLINRIFPKSEIAAQTGLLAARLAASAPLAMASVKRQLRASFEKSLHDQLEDEASSFAGNAATVDFREALAAFFEKRTPHFIGH